MFDDVEQDRVCRRLKSGVDDRCVPDRSAAHPVQQHSELSLDVVQRLRMSVTRSDGLRYPVAP
jgi:hypothetical protein